MGEKFKKRLENPGIDPFWPSMEALWWIIWDGIGRQSFHGREGVDSTSRLKGVTILKCGKVVPL